MATSIQFPNTSSVIKFPKKMFTPHSTATGLTVKHPRKRGTFRSTIPNIKPKDTFTGSDNPYAGIHFGSSTLSPQEAFALGYQKGHSSGSGSFLDSVKNGAGGILDHALNAISRPNWGVVRGYDEATKHGGFSLSHFVEGFKQGAIDGKAENWGQLLERRGDLKGHSFLRAGAGFGLDVLTDPTTYLFGAGVYAHAGDNALRVVKGLSDVEKTGGALKAAGRTAKAFPEGASEAQKAAITAENVLDERRALMEFKNSRNKYLELRFGITKSKSVGIKTGIRLRTAKDARLAKMANAGPLASVVHNLAADLVPGYKRPLEHLVENHALHVGEQQGQRMAHMAQNSLLGAAKALPDKADQMKALLAAVVPGAVAHGLLQHGVIEHELMQLGFEGDKLEQAKQFVDAYHHVGNQLKEEDIAFGVHYKDVGAGEKGIVYVPHIYEKTHDVASISRLQSVVGHAGFEKGKKLTLEKAMALDETARKKLIDDPIELMQRRIQKGAINQAHGSVRQYVMQHFAVPSRVLRPPEEVAKRMARVHLLNARIDKLQKQLKEHGSFGKARGKFHRSRMTQINALKEELAGITKRDLATRKHQFGVFQEERNKVDSQMAAIRKLKSDAGRKHTQAESLKLAQLTRQSRYLQHQMDATHTVESLTEQHVQELNALGVEHATKAHELSTQIDQAVKQLAEHEPKAIRKSFMKNPAIDKHLVRLDALKETHSLNALRAKVDDPTDYLVKLHEAAALTEKGKGMAIHYHVPPEIHDAVTRVEAVLNDPEKIGQIMRIFRKALSKWKLYVTMANPGYGMRNTMSDLWNAFIRGVPLHAMPRYAARAAQVMTRAHSGDPEAQAIIREAGYHGILTGFYNADIRQALKSKSNLSVVKHMTTGNIARENLGRLMHYLYRREGQHMNAAQAAEEVKIAHFDYEDLTPFEQQKLKAFIPFYTWTRKNVPLQIQQMVARPGRVNTYLKFASEEEQATGVSPGELATSVFSEHPLAFKTPLGYFDPNIGLSDLARITNPKQLAQMVSPFITVPLQYATNLNFFTGQPLEGSGAPHDLTPAPGFLADLLGGGTTGRIVGGDKRVHGPGINNALALLLQSVPLGSEVMAHNPVSEAQKKPLFNIAGIDAFPRDVSYGAGLSFTQPNQQEELFIQSFQAQENQAAALKAAREAGGYPEPKKQKKSAFQKRMEALIRAQMGR